MTKVSKRTFAKALKVADKPSNVKIDIRLCTTINVATQGVLYQISHSQVLRHFPSSWLSAYLAIATL